MSNLVRQQRELISTEPINVRIVGSTRPVRMSVRPVSISDRELYLRVIFQDDAFLAENDDPSANIPSKAARQQEEERETPQNELNLSRDRLQSMLEEYETSREAIRASNEELQSSNEELRSTLEELETSGNVGSEHPVSRIDGLVARRGSSPHGRVRLQ